MPFAGRLLSPPGLSLCLLLFAALALPAPSSAFDEGPPPLPSMAEREAFVLGHQPGMDLEHQERTARAVHDEYDVDHYDVTLALNIPAQAITGSVSIEARSMTADLGEINLDFFMPMVVDAVWVDGNPAVYSHIYQTLTVDLGGSYQPDEAFTVACNYHGTPVYNLAPFRWTTHAGVPMVLSYSEPYGAPAWWVCKDDPKDKATFSIHVTAPDNLFTVSNGRLDAFVNNGNGTATAHWLTDYPMSTYLFSIATTNFQSWTETYTALDQATTMGVDYFAYPEHLAIAQVAWGRNVEMMEYYASVFGEYPFLDEKYAIAEFQRTGAMEHQTATSYSNGYVVPSQYYDWIVAHELSHSWVGDMITMTEWSHAWCKEGFATFCEAIYFEDKYGEAYYHDYMNSMNALGYGGYQLFNISPPLSAAIYYKGAWVLHMLRHVLGDEDFFQGVYDYTNDPDFRYGTADTDDLRDVFEAASGVDLDGFFDQWIYSPGYPVYDVRWTSTPAGGGYDVGLRVEQVQSNAPIFKMPIDIAFNTGFGEVRFVIQDSLATQDFTLHLDFAPIGLTFDPDDWLIEEATIATAVADLPGPPGLFQNSPNPCNPSTMIRFTVSRSGPVALCLFDTRGRLMRSLLAAPVDAGEHFVRWDGKDSRGRELASGIYLYRLACSDGVWERKLTLLR